MTRAKTIETRILILGADAARPRGCQECPDPEDVLYWWKTEDGAEHQTSYCYDCAKELGIVGGAVRERGGVLR